MPSRLDYPLDLIARVLDAAPPQEGDRRIQRVVVDSRQVEPGDLFVALAGENTDGHAFVADAFQRGASGALVQQGRAVPGQPAQVEVDDPLLALGRLAAWHRNRFSVKVVAVTGSVGKTTTKDFVASVLSRQWKTLKSPASFNAEVGLPLTLLQLGAEHQAAVLEMAMRGPGQIRYLSRIARPEVAVITRIGLSHLELLGSQEAIAEAKAEVLDYLPREGTAILNAEDPYLPFLKSRVPEGVRIVTFGLERSDRNSVTGSYRGPAESDESHGPEVALGSRFTVRPPGGQIIHRGWIPLHGRHNVMNAMAAAAVGHALGVSWPRICRGLAESETSAMRMTVRRLPDGSLLLDDAYNASSPEAMLAALDVLKEIPGIRKTAILGSMLELGPTSEEAHRQVGQAVAALAPNALVTVGEAAAHIAEGALAGGLAPDRVAACADTDEALKLLRERRRPGDILLVKGSRGMAMERVVSGLMGRDPAK